MASFGSIRQAVYDRETRKQQYQAHIQGLNAYDRHKKFVSDYADMSHYKSGKIGLRWRTEKEVISGKGQFICGNKYCNQKDGLASYEVNFSYVEAGENKQALVKLVACERCAEKLLYKKRKEKEQMKEHGRKRERSENEHLDDEHERRERKKGKDHSKTNKNDENFEEYLEGMFL